MTTPVVDTTLRTLILRDLSMRLPADQMSTAKEQSQLWGEDLYRCRDWLERFYKAGLVLRFVRNVPRSPRDLRECAHYYFPHKEAILAELAKCS